jgi:hypothetical protein
MLIERLKVDKQLRRLCGWERRGELSSEATFSRAFAEFARSELPSRVHEALIKRTHEDRLVGHISRDATAMAFSIFGRPSAARCGLPSMSGRGIIWKRFQMPRSA